jgi:glycosyltransferase involved in cell wall biosynthesis
MNDLVSVCVVTRNRREDLRKCIDSVLLQDYDNFEIIVLDVNSTDGSEALLYDYQGEYLNNIKITLKFLWYDEFNVMKTLNEATRLARGKFLFVLDDDAILLDSGIISRLIREIVDDVAVIGCKIIDKDGSRKQMDSDPPFLQYHGAAAMFRRSDLESVGYYDESFVIYMNELDLSLKLIKNGRRIVISDDCEVLHSTSRFFNIGRVRYFFANYNKVVIRNSIGIRKIIYLILGNIINFGYLYKRSDKQLNTVTTLVSYMAREFIVVIPRLFDGNNPTKLSNHIIGVIIKEDLFKYTRRKWFEWRYK